MADFKDPPRVRDADLMRLLHMENDCCEVTGLTGRLHVHHVRLRSQGGSDVRGNLLVLHDDLHVRYHAADPVARRLVAEHVRDNRPDIQEHLSDRYGKEWFQEWMAQHLAENSSSETPGRS